MAEMDIKYQAVVKDNDAYLGAGQQKKDKVANVVRKLCTGKQRLQKYRASF